MAWCQTNGLRETALHYGGGVATVESWLGWYDDMLDEHPTSAVLGAWLYVLTGRAAEGADWLRAAQGSTAMPELPDGSASIEPWIATLRSYTCPDGVERMLADAELALEQLGPAGWWRPVAQLGAGTARALLGDDENARPALTLAAEMTAAANAHDACSVAFAELALLAMAAGAWEEAADHAGRGVTLVEELRLDDYLGCGLAMVAAARIAVQRESARRPVGTVSTASDVTDRPESKQQASKRSHRAPHRHDRCSSGARARLTAPACSRRAS
jgi:LuxR family maltose regulon positive regulatory protein